MPRPLPTGDRRLAEEAVRQGLVAAVVMEAAAREWTALEGEESFAAYLVRREVLKADQRDALRSALPEEEPDPAAGVDEGEAATGKAPHPSEIVKGYRILERLGRGGMGSVYRAEQQGMNRVVALKILRRPFGDSEEHVERLKREARLVGALDHPNIVRGLDVGSHGPYHYFAMEFVEGDTLRELLRKRGVVPESEALRIVEAVCQALDHAHARGVVHRDVKPGNIMLTPDGTPKLTDYGLAKGPADFTLTQSGVTIGTPQYISPEQAREPAGVDVQTDIYSLGATAYHMLTGVPPHSSDTLAGLLTKVLYEKPRTARQVNPRVSAGASFLVEKMMAKQRKHRYREPRDVLADLRALAAGKTIVPRDWAGDFEVHEVRRKYRMAVMGGAAVVAAIAALAVGLQVQEQRENRRIREENSSLTLSRILGESTPRSRQDCADLLDSLDRFLRTEDFAGTPSIRTAREERARAEGYLAVWDRAESCDVEAGKLHRAMKHNEAVALLEKAAEEIARKDGVPGRFPAAALRDRTEAIREDGRREAAKEIERALKDVAKVPPLENALAEVERRLQWTRDRVYENLLAEPDRPPRVQELDALLERLREVRAEIEVSCFGEGYRARRDAAIRDGAFRSVEEELEEIERRIGENARLQSLLDSIPAPAAEAARGRGRREAEALRAADEANLRALLDRTREFEAARDWESALDLLERAEPRRVRDLQKVVRVARDAVASRRDAAQEAAQRAVAQFLDGFLQDLARRDYLGAERRVVEPAQAGDPGVRGRAMTEAVLAAATVLHWIRKEALDPIRKRVQEGGEFPKGLQFEEGPRHLHPEVENVRLRETETGPVLVFDAGKQKGVTGDFHRISVDLLLEYAGLKGQGLSAGQAVVRAALLVSEGERRDRRLLEDQASLLRRLRDTPALALVVPVVDALVAKADDFVAARIRGEENLEKTAQEHHDRVLVALGERDPRQMRHLLGLLLDKAPLKATRYVEERRKPLEALRATAEAMADNQELEDYFRGFVVERAGDGRDGDGLTRMRCTFDDDAVLRSFVLREDGGPFHYRVVRDAEGNGSAGGRLVFLEGDPDRGLPASPLVVECPFKPTSYIAVSFRYRSDAPLYLQVSVVGSNLGVLTDDGRRTSGRGVYAWQGDWKDPDRFFPATHRHDEVAKLPDPLKVKDDRGLRHFQFEPGVTYAVRVEWDKGRLRLVVDGREIWNADLGRYAKENPPRFRIVTYTGGWIDDLVLEGVLDRRHFDRLRKKP